MLASVLELHDAVTKRLFFPDGCLVDRRTPAPNQLVRAGLSTAVAGCLGLTPTLDMRFAAAFGSVHEDLFAFLVSLTDPPGGSVRAKLPTTPLVQRLVESMRTSRDRRVCAADSSAPLLPNISSPTWTLGYIPLEGDFNQSRVSTSSHAMTH